MAGFILGKKIRHSQSITEKGVRVPTTLIQTNPCYLLEVKIPEKHGYFSLKLGFDQGKNINKSVEGEIKKAGVKTQLRFLREFRAEPYAGIVKPIEEEGKKGILIGENKLFIGDELKPSALFKKGEYVDATGISKGKGFQGVVKRHHFKGGPRTHGQSDRERAPGSIGQTTTPGRVYKGKRMAGRMGGDTKTVRRLMILDASDTGLLIKGLIPGSLGSVIRIRSSR